MEINFNTFNLLDSIIYRANIFNYDNKFLSIVREINSPMKIKYEDVSDQSYISCLIQHLKCKSKEQLEKIAKIDIKLKEEIDEGELSDDVEQIQKNYSSSKSEDKKFFYCLFELIKNYLERLESENLDYENTEVNQLKEFKANHSSYSNTILFGLLYLDGLVMINIDNISKINKIAESHEFDFVDLLIRIIRCKNIDINSREIASHLLSSLLGFCDLESSKNDNFHFILKWTEEHYILTKRDNVLTSNYGLLFSADECVEYFLKTYDSERRLIKSLFEIMKKDNYNIIYESLFAIWNISNFTEYISIFESKYDNFLETIVSVIKTNKIDKIARVGLMIIKNLLISQRCLEVLLDISFMRTIDTLLTNKWNDSLIKESLNFIYDYLDKNYKFLNSFEKYIKEIESGDLKWGSLHTNDFWEDNYKEFEREGFKYIKMLCDIVNKTEPVNDNNRIEMISVACFDIGEFARLYPGGALILEGMKIKERLMTLIINPNLEIKNRALVCLQKIMMRTIRN